MPDSPFGNFPQEILDLIANEYVDDIIEMSPGSIAPDFSGSFPPLSQRLIDRGLGDAILKRFFERAVFEAKTVDVGSYLIYRAATGVTVQVPHQLCHLVQRLALTRRQLWDEYCLFRYEQEYEAAGGAIRRSYLNYLPRLRELVVRFGPNDVPFSGFLINSIPSVLVWGIPSMRVFRIENQSNSPSADMLHSRLKRAVDEQIRSAIEYGEPRTLVTQEDVYDWRGEPCVVS